MYFLGTIDGWGKTFLHYFFFIRSLIEGVLLSVQSFAFSERKVSRAHFVELFHQVYFTGVQAAPPTLIVAIALGFFSAFYTSSDLFLLGNSQALSRILTQISTDFFGPLIVSFLVVARSCTAVASELGTMKVNHEIDTLRLICKDPYGFLVFPRIFGGSIAVICLGVLFTAALIGTYCLALYFSAEISPIITFEAFTRNWTIGSIFLLVVKYALPALAIFSIATKQGLSAKRSSHEVPIVTSTAVLQSLYAIFLCQSAIALLQYSYLNGGQQ
jgi:phospholipid/cholesterol/gamma-HCH transport system permease protein